MSGETQQQFIVFINSAIDDLVNSRLSPEQALVAVRQFPYLNSQVLAQLDSLSASDNEAFKTNLISILHRVLRDQKVVWAKLPDSEISLPSPLSEREIVERAQNLHQALQTSILVTKNQRVAFARRLAQNWSKQLRLTQEQEALFVNKLTEEAQNIPVRAGVEEVRDRIGKVLETTTEGSRLSKNTIQRDILAEEQKQQTNALALTRTIILHDGPGIVALAGTIQKKLEEKPPQTIGQFEEALLESDRLVRVQEVLTSDVIPSHNAVNLSLGKVLSSFAGNESQAKIGLFIGDTVGLFFDRETQDKIVNAIIAKSEAKISSDAADSERRFGKDAKTAEFQEAMKAMAAGAAGVAAPTGLAGFVTGILKSYVGQKLIGSPDQFLLTTLELQAKGLLSAEIFLGKKKIIPEGLPQNLTASIWAEAETITVFYAAIYKEIAHYGYLSYLYISNKIGFSYDKTGNFIGWILGVGAKKGLEKGAMVAAKEAAKTGVGAALTKLLTALGVSAGGPVGGFFAWLGSTVIIGGLGKIFGGLVGFLSNPFAALGALAKPKSWYDPSTENGLTVLLIITLIAVLLFPMILGSSLPLALVTSSRGSGPSEESPEQFQIPANLTIATGPIGCPVNNGRITQGPFEGFSHSGVDAYDIAASDGSVVKATHKAVVVKIVGSFAKNQFAYGNFGNYVRLAGKNEKGETFWTTYAHLLGAEKDLIEGQTIEAGAVIGYVDNTGYSEGTHLHYQYNGPGRLALPKGCAGT